MHANNLLGNIFYGGFHELSAYKMVSWRKRANRGRKMFRAGEEDFPAAANIMALASGKGTHLLIYYE